MTSTDPEYLTATEAAAVLRVNVRTVYRRAALLQAVRVGRALRIPAASLAPAKTEGAAA